MRWSLQSTQRRIPSPHTEQEAGRHCPPKPFSALGTSESAKHFGPKRYPLPPPLKTVWAVAESRGQVYFQYSTTRNLWGMLGVFTEAAEKIRAPETCACEVLTNCVKAERGQKLFSTSCLPCRRTWNLWVDCLAPVWRFFYVPYSTWKVLIHTGAWVGSLLGDGAPLLCAQNSKTGLSLLGKAGWNQSTWKEYPVLKAYSWQSQESTMLRMFSFTLYLFHFCGDRSNGYLLFSPALKNRTATALKMAPNSAKTPTKPLLKFSL